MIVDRNPRRAKRGVNVHDPGRRAAGRISSHASPAGTGRDGHSTVNAVNPFVFADLGNAPTFSDTKVEIDPARASDS